MDAAFRAAILAWYDARGRSLPFRGTRDPYAIVVSETMAQQTQIGRVGPAWERFVATFPSFEALAAASPADVQRAWQGLGYNRRALLLQRTARAVVEEHGGQLPSEVGELERLPGIGPYTARAVAAIGFGAPVGAVDTNVRRVLGRVVAGDAHALSARELQVLADQLVPPDRTADWTHAVMDVGATFCRSRRPLCDGCPARPWCGFAAAGNDTASVSAAQPRTQPRGKSRSVAKAAPFETTSRWLRGRILDRLRAAKGDAWTTFVGSIGPHAHGTVLVALATLDREGLLELSSDDPSRARIPAELSRLAASG